VNQDIISAFFSQALQAVGGTKQTGSPVLNVYINHEKRFSFVEFRTVEETSNAMALDGILFEGSNVRVRRPNDYNPAFAATLGPSTPSPDLKLDVVGLHPGGYVSA
jgi:splicing factor U2AF subunit